MEEMIRDFDSLRKKWLLAYVSYPSGFGTVCFAYPQYAFEGKSVRQVSPEALPDIGALRVAILQSRTLSRGAKDWAENEYGEIVAVRVNASPGNLLLDEGYTDNGTSCRHFAKMHPNLPSGESEVEFQRLSRASGTRNLLQVVELEEKVDFSSPTRNPIRLADANVPMVSAKVVIEQQEGSELAYYGPFDCLSAGSGLVRLSATETAGLYVFRLRSDQSPKVIQVADPFHGIPALVKLMDGSGFASGNTRAERLDWVTDENLIERVARGLKSAKLLKGCTVTDFAKAVEGCRLDGVYASRRERMNKLAQIPRFWEDLGESIVSVMMRPEVEDRLMEIAQSDRFFPAIEKRLVDMDSIREKVAHAEEEEGRELSRLTAERKRAERELEEIKSEINQIRTLCSETKARALSDARSELASLERETISKRKELDRINRDIDEAERRQSEVHRKVGAMFEDKDGLAAELLKDSVLRRAAEQASSTSRARIPSRAASIDVAVRRETPADGRQIAEELRSLLSERANRDISYAEAVNLMVCIVQSPMTILSGPPGQGRLALSGTWPGRSGSQEREESASSRSTSGGGGRGLRTG